ERGERATAELGPTGEGGHLLAGDQPEALEEAAGAFEAVPAERAEELLGAVGGEVAADGRTEPEQGEITHVCLLGRPDTLVRGRAGTLRPGPPACRRSRRARRTRGGRVPGPPPARARGRPPRRRCRRGPRAGRR